MPPKLFLVKHSHPEILRARPPEEWNLSEEGRKRADRLADYLADSAAGRIVSSPEPKSVQTAQIVARRIGLRVEIQQDLREHPLSGEWFAVQPAFEAAVTRFFENPDQLVLGGETADQANLRFEQAVASLVASGGRDSMVLVSHGRVMSLFAAHRFGEDRVSFWRRLGLPALVSLELPGLAPIEVVERF